MYRLTLSGGMWQLLWGTCTFAISLKLGLGQIPLTWYEGESAWNKGNVPAFVQVHWCLRVGLSHPEVEFHIFPQALQVQDLWGSSHRLLYRSPAEGRKLAQCPGEGGGWSGPPMERGLCMNHLGRMRGGQQEAMKNLACQDSPVPEPQPLN